MPAEKPTFVLGLGHQKCGTSWVYRYLAQSPRFARGFVKEYHVWDALDLDALRRHKVRRLKTLFPFDRFGGAPVRAARKLRYRMQNEEDFYFDYFASLLDGERRITADITPSYSGLGTGRLATIKRRFESRNIEVKALVFIRDPLARIKSATRFNLDRGDYTEGIRAGETDFVAALEQYYPSEHCALRTRYDRTISAALEVFGPEGLHVGVYEDMFGPEEVQRLSVFLGVGPKPDFAGVKVNETQGSVGQTGIDDRIRAHYAPVYEYCFDMFPRTRELWDRP
jgi:hypothetical protein